MTPGPDLFEKASPALTDAMLFHDQPYRHPLLSLSQPISAAKLRVFRCKKLRRWPIA